jgi:hypothetical protein
MQGRKELNSFVFFYSCLISNAEINYDGDKFLFYLFMVDLMIFKVPLL